MQIVDVPELEPSAGEYARLLGAGRDAAAEPRIVRWLAQARELATGRVQARGVFGIFLPEETERLCVPLAWVEGACAFGLAAVTIGPGVEERVSELNQEGEHATALILDAYASAMTEAVADRACELLRAEGAAIGLGARKRRSPGYGSWGIEYQAGVLEMLAADRIGIERMPSMLMIPRKSISFGLPLGRGFGENHSIETDKCDECDLVNCTFRGPK